MIRVGVIGAPGAGKTRFASALKRGLPEENLLVIDGYADKLNQRLEMSVGIESSYLPNVHISSLREQEVRKASLEDRNFIVCGTMFETLCYAGFHTEIIANGPGTEDQKNTILMREVTAAQMFAYMAIDTSQSLTHLFYLPITDPALIIAISKKDNINEPPGEHEAFDKTIQDALRRYGNPATVLNGKHHKNVQAAIEIIKSGKNGTHTDESPVAGE